MTGNSLGLTLEGIEMAVGAGYPRPRCCSLRSHRCVTRTQILLPPTAMLVARLPRCSPRPYALALAPPPLHLPHHCLRSWLEIPALGAQRLVTKFLDLAFLALDPVLISRQVGAFSGTVPEWVEEFAKEAVSKGDTFAEESRLLEALLAEYLAFPRTRHIEASDSQAWDILASDKSHPATPDNVQAAALPLLSVFLDFHPDFFASLTSI